MTSLTRRLITLTVMIVTILEILDMTIVTVSLPAMMGSLSCNSEQIAWVLTSYIVAAAIIMPLTGFFVNRVGQKRLMITCILGFMASSALCGLSSSLVTMVTFRSLQGLFGATLVPLSQKILRDAYPPEQHAKAMAIWGMGVMVAPILGPTLGGYITEHYSWRWLFYINIPFCLVSYVLAQKLIPTSKRLKEKIDWLAVALLAISVACLQLFLDQGNYHDWFDSNMICFLCAGFVITLFFFILQNRSSEHPVIHFELLRNQPFTWSNVLIFLFGGTVIASFSLQPVMMEMDMHYSAMMTGMILGPRGLASAIGMVIASQSIKRVGARRLILLGLVLSIAGMLWMASFERETPRHVITWVGMLQGVGIGLFFVPLSTFGFQSLLPHQVAEATGLFSFARSLGIAVGISIMSTLITRHRQTNWVNAAHTMTPYSDGLHQWLAHHHFPLTDPKTLMPLALRLHELADVLAYRHAFLVGVAVLVALLVVVVATRVERCANANTAE